MSAVFLESTNRSLALKGPTLAVLLAFVLVGCTANTPYMTKTPQQTNYIYTDSYDRVWGVVVSALHADGLSLEVIDKDSGIISGVKRLEPSTLDMLANYSARLASSITVQRVGNGTQVSINSTNERKHEEHDWRPAGPADAYSAGLFQVINPQLTLASSAQAGQQSSSQQTLAPTGESAPAITDRESIREAQRILNSLGFNAGPEDGIMGSRTANAVMLYQGKAGLASTGRLDEQTAQSLRSAASNAGIKLGQSQTTNASTSNPSSSSSTKPEATTTRSATGPSAQSIGRGTVSVATEMKAAADPFSEALVALPSGVKVEILGNEGDWVKVRYSGREGYVLASFVAQ